MPYAFRLLGGSPIFTVVAILTLGHGDRRELGVFDAGAAADADSGGVEQVVLSGGDGSVVGFPKNTRAAGNAWVWRRKARSLEDFGLD